MLRFQVVTTLLLLTSSTIGQFVTPFASPTAAVCGLSHCYVSASPGKDFGWAQGIVNTTIVAATVVTIVNTDLKTSRITTIFNALPDGYTLPLVNSDGTATQRITYTRLGQTYTTDLAFPSEFRAYLDAYTWNGTLAAGGTCLTANTPSVGYLSSFPPQPPVTFPTYEEGTITITDDTKGLYFSPVTDLIQLEDYAAFYTDVAALNTCTVSVPIPAIPHWTAQFLTHTSTSYEGGGDTMTTATAAPIMSPPPPAVLATPTSTPPPPPPPPPPPSAASSEPPPQQTIPDTETAPSSTSSPSPYQPPPTVQSTTSMPANGANFTSSSTSLAPTPSLLQASDGILVASLSGFMRALALMGASIFLLI